MLQIVTQGLALRVARDHYRSLENPATKVEFRTIWGIYRLAERVLAIEERLCPIS